MDGLTQSYVSFWDQNRKALSVYLWLLAVVAVVGLGYLLIEGKYRYLYAMGIPVAFMLTVAQPRLALYQFVVLITVNYYVWLSPVVLLADLSAMIVICAATLDLFLKGELPKRFPPVLLNLVLLIVAMFIAGLFGYNPSLMFKPLIRVGILAVTFVSVYRLSRYVTMRHVLTVFFWVTVAHAAYALAPSIAAGRVERVFGLAFATLDDLLMIAVPIGLTIYLWENKGKAWLYLAGTSFAMLVLLATQSRLPIVFALVLCAGVVVLSRREGKGGGDMGSLAVPVIRRIRVLLSTVIVLAVLVVSVQPGLISAVIERFEQLFTMTPGGTFRIRLLIWKSALMAFWDHPILGIGTGQFKSLMAVYPELRMDSLFIWIQGLSAHNSLLHYMAETGLVGASLLIALFVRQFQAGLGVWRHRARGERPDVELALFMVALLFLFSVFIEAGWMWGHTSYMFAMFLGLIVRRRVSG